MRNEIKTVLTGSPGSSHARLPFKEITEMKEKYRKVKAMIRLARMSLRLPAWAVLCLADSIRRGGGSESFHREIPKLQKRAYEIQQKNRDKKDFKGFKGFKEVG